jgi:nucleoside-diphosphate-sugar epimerase
VVVTGAAGRLARVLIPVLLADPEVESVLGVDRRASELRHPRYRFLRADLRHPGLAAAFSGHDALVHLAFVLMGGGLGAGRHDRERVRSANLDGARAAFEAAAAVGMRRAVFLSSVAAYGAWPDNPSRLREDRALRPNPGFAYAEDKAAVEDWLEDFAQGPAAPVVLRLRAHAIVGPRAHPLLRLLTRLPLRPALGGVEPLTQCLWEDDAATAMRAALHRGTPGAYNLAAEPAMSLAALHRAAGRRPLPLPLGPLERLQALAWRLTPAAGDPGWVQGLRHDLAVDCRRAETELGWRARRSTLDCFTAEN